MSIKNDYLAYKKHTESSIKPFLKTMFYANVIFRISFFLYKLKLVPLSRLFWLVNRVLFAIDIDPRAHLQKGFVILHGVGIVIGRYVIAVGNFKIYQGATLGGNNGKEAMFNGEKLRQPLIGDNVIIGINAVVIGPILINDGVKIGANSTVTKDIPENAIVVSNNKILNILNL